MKSVKCKVKSEKGITLVESLVTLAIATIVGILLMVIIVNTGSLFYKQSSKLEQGLNINDALSRIGRSIRESYAVSASYPESPPTTYTSDSSQLVLKVPSIDASGDIIPNTYDYFVFLKDQNFLRFESFPDSLSTRTAEDQIFSSRVEELIFEYFDSSTPPQQVSPSTASKLRVSLKLKQKAGAGVEQNIATSEANLRND